MSPTEYALKWGGDVYLNRRCSAHLMKGKRGEKKAKEKPTSNEHQSNRDAEKELGNPHAANEKKKSVAPQASRRQPE